MSAASFSLDKTFGAAFVGFAVSSLCLGVLSMQTYNYFRTFPLDKTYYKVMVSAVWALEFADQALIAHAVYTYVVTNWGDKLILIKPPVWSLVIQITLGVVTGTVVKLNYAMRVWRFSKMNIPVTGLIVLLTVGELGVACVYTYQGLILDSLLDIGKMKMIGTLSLGLGVGTDVAIAASLCWFLGGLRTGHRQDDSMVNNLILGSLSTGLLTSLISLVTLILYNFMPDNFIFMGMYFVLSKVYANSFLAALNTRRVSRGRGTDNDRTTVPTFLMVGKTTQRSIHIDPEQATHSPISPADSHNYAQRW
ncbi:uncharacterized protein BXZ73DRAFT_103513 [Epithele typhae]|uniref:uncharacterized protein n=1 Tax=Epithele typhae TaxID=378194 RepID=UPI002008BA65|nr:uncharacterized protein BXZ73DRAFT_103513 [Epithele typhae]KAH9924673.1 hypothetical protein BXZ73DRAFT_103513 [Epithele typhae]